MYLSKLRQEWSQGDILKDVELIDSAAPRALPKNYRVIILSHDCDLDKQHNSVVLVCAIRDLTEVSDGFQGDIRKNRVANVMYLEGTNLLEESFVDFRYVFRVDKTFLKQAVKQGARIASLNDEARLALMTFLYRFFARKTHT